MQKNKTKGFTVIEMLVGLAILSFIISGAIFLMTRGAKNVKKGSFNTLAANQAFWIFSSLREDLSRCEGLVEIDSQDPNVTSVYLDENNSLLCNIVIDSARGDKASYTREANANGHINIIRHLVRDGSSLKQKFGDEYLKSVVITKGSSNSDPDGNPDANSNSNTEFDLTIVMSDSDSNAGGKNELTWKAKLYIPVSQNLRDQFWYSTVDNANANPNP